MLEKFHFPALFFTSRTSGFLIVKEVTFTWREKIRGIHSSPICREDACTNRPLLHAASSLMPILRASAPPLKHEAWIFPMLTLRPRAAESLLSISGRKLSTLMKSGTSRTVRMITPRTMPRIIHKRFIKRNRSSNWVMGEDYLGCLAVKFYECSLKIMDIYLSERNSRRNSSFSLESIPPCFFDKNQS